MKKEFGLISEIDINEPDTWENKIFITLDIDWADDKVLQYCIELFIKYQVKATWFSTHYTTKLDLLLKNKLFEVGIHPNFNHILSNRENDSFQKIFNDILKIVPLAKCTRSHSLTQSTQTIYYAYNQGIKYDLNTFIPLDSEIKILPYKHSSGIVQIAHIWEDDVHYLNKWNYDWAYKKIMNYKGLCVLDFHPIHIFLNTEKEETYENAKIYNKDFNQLKLYRNTTEVGTNFFLLKLISND